MAEIIEIKTPKKTNKGFGFFWKEKKVTKEETVENCVKTLKEKKICFRVLSGNFVVNYHYNGNNYIVKRSLRKLNS